MNCAMASCIPHLCRDDLEMTFAYPWNMIRLTRVEPATANCAMPLCPHTTLSLFCEQCLLDRPQTVLSNHPTCQLPGTCYNSQRLLHIQNIINLVSPHSLGDKFSLNEAAEIHCIEAGLVEKTEELEFQLFCQSVSGKTKQKVRTFFYFAPGSIRRRLSR